MTLDSTRLDGVRVVVCKWWVVGCGSEGKDRVGYGISKSLSNVGEVIQSIDPKERSTNLRSCTLHRVNLFTRKSKCWGTVSNDPPLASASKPRSESLPL